jgi:hypothetical protein
MSSLTDEKTFIGLQQFVTIAQRPHTRNKSASVQTIEIHGEQLTALHFHCAATM